MISDATPDIILLHTNVLRYSGLKKKKKKLGERNANANTHVCSDHFIRAVLASWLTWFWTS